MNITKQKVYIGANGEQKKCVCYDNDGSYDYEYIEGVVEKEGYFFTSEQLNEYTSNVIKKALDNAIEKYKLEQKNYFEATDEEHLKGIDIYEDNGSDRPSFVAFLDKESITNTFEETFNEFKV